MTSIQCRFLFEPHNPPSGVTALNPLDPPIRVVHIITGLGTGGAETMLYKLLSVNDANAFAPQVISLRDLGALGPRIQALGIPVHCLRMGAGIPSPAALWRLYRLLRKLRPRVVQTWMYHADFLGGLAARAAGIRAVAWNLRQSELDPARLKRSTYLIVRWCARLSGWLPQAIVSCSEQARRNHLRFGYAGACLRVIPNGFDMHRFQPDPVARQRLREQWRLQPETLLVGLVARFDPQKDHGNFIRAAAELKQRLPACHFVLCGDGVDSANARLTGWIDSAGLNDCVHLLGRRQDIPQINAALDLAVSASAYGEGFPNVLGEAMACGVPCVTTDVGDSAWIVGDAGAVVRPGDAAALAAAMLAALTADAEQRARAGAAARARILRHFSLPHVAERYARLHRSLAGL